MSDTPKLQQAADGGCPPATCSALQFSTVDQLREHVEGRWTLKKCPQCSARLLTNNAGNEWCSYAHCDYGLTERHKECGHEKVSMVNGHCFQCDVVVCPRCNGTRDVIIEGHICDCPDCFPQNAGAVAPPPQMPDSTNDAPGG